MQSRGITLISLIITIVVILILSAVGITTTVSLIDNAKKSAFIARMSAIEEAVSLKIMANEIGLLTGETTNEEVFQTKMLVEELEDLSDSVKFEILRAWEIEQGLTPSDNLEDINMEITELADFLFRLGDDITGDTSYASIYDSKVGAVYKIEPVIIGGKAMVGTGNSGMLAGKKKIIKSDNTEQKIIITKGDYIKIKGTETDYYVCTPDLSGFRTEDTYYVTHDETAASFTPIIGNKIGRENPENWYDFEKKVWPNVLSANNGKKTYWVWIPRYVYKTTYYTDAAKTILSNNNNITAYGDVDVRFVDINNIYKDSNGQETDYTGSTEYLLPEGFNFGNVQASGIWVSKYELSNTVPNDEFKKATIKALTNKILIEPTVGVTNAGAEINDIYLNGVKVKEKVTLPQELTDLENGKEYDVAVIRYSGVNPINVFSKRITTGSAPNIPDLSDFDAKITYYVTYDINGNPIVGNKIGKGEPQTWYDYERKICATVLVSDDNGTEYFTWTPRYEQEIGINGTKVYNGTANGYEADINFIPTSKTQAEFGYEIPAEFKQGGAELSGIWTASNKVATKTMNRAWVIPDNSKIKVDIPTLAITNRNINKNDIYVDGVKLNQETLSYTIENLELNKEYEISVRGYYNSSGKILPTNTYTRTIKAKRAVANAPDLSGFNPDVTYYVEYDSEGNELNPEIENKTKISKDENGNWNLPTNWYNYENKNWANIVTYNAEKKAYWVWMPRYEYLALPEGMSTTAEEMAVNVHFIPETQVTPSEGFLIPEAFSFGGKDLPGIWVSKYELSN